MLLSRDDHAVSLFDALRDSEPVLSPRPVRAVEDRSEALAALSEADSRFLLMSLVHLTGDEALLDRFAPYISMQSATAAKGVTAAGIPDDMQEELRNQVADLLAQDTPPQERPVSARLLQRMASVCAGEAIADEFLPLILDDLPPAGLSTIVRVLGVDS